MKERRRSRRIGLKVLVNYSQETSGLSQNLNLQGISIISDEPFQENVFLNLLFSLPDGQTINSLGRIIWCNEFKKNKFISGIEFVSISEQDKKKIEDFSGHSATEP